VTWRVVIALLGRLPQGALSRLTGWTMDRRLPGFLRRPLVGAFARLAGIDTSEGEAPPGSYPSLGAYFTRRLRPGVRTWPEPGPVARTASPVDGIVGAFGRILPSAAGASRLIQAKGIEYDAGSLLGEATEGERFAGGSFLTIYLSPRHYHRIHTPLAARIRSARSIPGRLLPVNLAAVHTVPDLFPRNERLVVHLEPSQPSDAPGPVALVAVGAFNVGRISAAFDPGWHTNRPRRERPAPETRGYDLEVGGGAELATFHLGSTVVLLFAPGEGQGEAAGDGAGGASPPAFSERIAEGAPIRLGDRIFTG
jgi:phosphatidylserine decarboxylase